MRTILWITILLLFVPIALAEALERSPAPDDARVYIQSPEDGAVVTSPVTIRFGLKGLGIAPAGIQFPNTGHHHVLIDVAEGDMPSFDQSLPATNQIVHFGLGQTEVEIDLELGQHTLQLVLGDYLHLPHSPPVISERITITVIKGVRLESFEK